MTPKGKKQKIRKQKIFHIESYHYLLVNPKTLVGLDPNPKNSLVEQNKKRLKLIPQKQEIKKSEKILLRKAVNKTVALGT